MADDLQIARLAALLHEGEMSGTSEPWDLESFLAEERARDVEREAGLERGQLCKQVSAF